MTENGVKTQLPPIPAKRYFTIGEVSDLCGVKPHVLRYWEQEFTQLKPVKRRGNRRYYQHHEVLLIRRIRELLYEQGFTISGARNRLNEPLNGDASHGVSSEASADVTQKVQTTVQSNGAMRSFNSVADIKSELQEILLLLQAAQQVTQVAES